MPFTHKKSRYSPFPNELDAYIPLFTMAEHKMIHVLIRETCGFKWRLWAALSVDDLCEKTGLSKQSVISASATLEKMGLIFKEHVFHGETGGYTTCRYRVRFTEDEPEEESSDMVKRLDCVNSDTVYSLDYAEAGEGLTVRIPNKEVKEKIYSFKEKTITPIPPLGYEEEKQKLLEEVAREESRTLEGEKFNLEAVDVDSPIEEFVKNAYSRENRRAKLEKLNTRAGSNSLEKLQSAESTYGKAEFRLLLLNFLRTDSSNLREKKWGLWMFLANPDKYQGLPAPYVPPAVRAQHTRPAISVPSEDANQPPPLPADRPGSFDAEGIWLKVIAPERPLPRWDVLAAKKLSEDKDLTAEIFEQVCMKVKILRQEDPKRLEWLGLAYLVKEKDGIPGWEKIRRWPTKQAPPAATPGTENPIEDGFDKYVKTTLDKFYEERDAKLKAQGRPAVGRN